MVYLLVTMVDGRRVFLEGLRSTYGEGRLSIRGDGLRSSSMDFTFGRLFTTSCCLRIINFS